MGLSSTKGRYLFIGYANGRLALISTSKGRRGVVWTTVLDQGSALTSLQLYGDVSSLRLSGLWRFSSAAAHSAAGSTAYSRAGAAAVNYQPPSLIAVPDTSLIARSGNHYWRLKIEAQLPMPLVPVPLPSGSTAAAGAAGGSKGAAATPSKGGGAPTVPASPYKGLQPLTSTVRGGRGAPTTINGRFTVPLYTQSLLDVTNTSLVTAAEQAEAEAGGNTGGNSSSNKSATATKAVAAAIAAAERTPGGPLALMYEASVSSPPAALIVFAPAASTIASITGMAAGGVHDSRAAAAAAAAANSSSGGGGWFGRSSASAASPSSAASKTGPANVSAGLIIVTHPLRAMPSAWSPQRLRQNTKRTELSIQYASKGPLVCVVAPSDAKLRLFDPSLGEDPLLETLLPLPWVASSVRILRASYTRILTSQLPKHLQQPKLLKDASSGSLSANKGERLKQQLKDSAHAPPVVPVVKKQQQSKAPSRAAVTDDEGAFDDESLVQGHDADAAEARRALSQLQASLAPVPFTSVTAANGSAVPILALPECLVLYSDKLLFVAQNPSSGSSSNDASAEGGAGGSGRDSGGRSWSMDSSSSITDIIDGSKGDDVSSGTGSASAAAASCCATVSIVSVNLSCRALRDATSLEHLMNKLSISLPLPPGAAANAAEWPPGRGFSLPSDAVVQRLTLPPGCYVQSLERVPLLRSTDAGPIVGPTPTDASDDDAADGGAAEDGEISTPAASAAAAIANARRRSGSDNEGDGGATDSEDSSGTSSDAHSGDDYDGPQQPLVRGASSTQLQMQQASSAGAGSSSRRCARPPYVQPPPTSSSGSGSGNTGGSGALASQLLFSVAVHTTSGTFAVTPRDVLAIDATIKRLISDPAAGILPSASSSSGSVAPAAAAIEDAASSSSASMSAVVPASLSPSPSFTAARRRLAGLERLCFSLSLDPSHMYEGMADGGAGAEIDALLAEEEAGSISAATSELRDASSSSANSSSIGRSLCDYYRTLNADALPPALVNRRPRYYRFPGKDSLARSSDANRRRAEETAADASAAVRPLLSSFALYGLAAGLGGECFARFGRMECG